MLAISCDLLNTVYFLKIWGRGTVLGWRPAVIKLAQSWRSEEVLSLLLIWPDTRRAAGGADVSYPMMASLILTKLSGSGFTESNNKPKHHWNDAKRNKQKKSLPRQDYQPWDCSRGVRSHSRGDRGSWVGWGGVGLELVLLVEHYCAVTLNEHLSLFTSVAFCRGVCGVWGSQCLPWSRATVEKASLLTSGFLLIPVHPPWSPEGILWLRIPLSPHHLQAWFRVLASEERKEFWHMHVVWKFQNRQLCQIYLRS